MIWILGITVTGYIIYLFLTKGKDLKFFKEIFKEIPIPFKPEPEEPEGDPAKGHTEPQGLCADFPQTSVRIVDLPDKVLRVVINTNYLNQFQTFADYLALNNIGDYIDRVDGFNCRKIRDTGIWSFHSYGQAIDINPDQFPPVDLDANPGGRYDVPHWLLALADTWRNLGGVWGGDWILSFYDPMHFQIGTRIPR